MFAAAFNSPDTVSDHYWVPHQVCYCHGVGGDMHELLTYLKAEAGETG